MHWSETRCGRKQSRGVEVSPCVWLGSWKGDVAQLQDLQPQDASEGSLPSQLLTLLTLCSCEVLLLPHKLVCVCSPGSRAGRFSGAASHGGWPGWSVGMWLGNLGTLAEMAPGETQQEEIWGKTAGGAALMAGRRLLEVKFLL